MKKNRITTFGAAVMIFAAAVSCEKKDSETKNDRLSGSSEEIWIEETTEKDPADVRGQTITWLADYDLAPQNNDERPTALALFEDVYGAHVNYVQTSYDDKYSTLESMINGGEEVDMFPYERDAFPNGVMKELFEPLDPYFDIMGVDDGLWDDMADVIDMFGYNGSHYVMPYAVTKPQVIIYSRKLMKSVKLDDPYELYLDGKWDWDAMMKMMKAFVSKAEDGKPRYGINGSFGQAVIQSTGHTVVNYDDGVFSNNIGDPEIEKAEKFMQKIVSEKLYDPDWKEYFPDDESTLFYAASDRALGRSNAKNPDADLMIVPFPKAPDADKIYLSCDFSARMLVRGSQKCEAVATYIKCERIAAAHDEYKELAKQTALVVQKKSFVTEEQYDALQSCLDRSDMTPVFDFSYGMGGRMYGDGDYNYETRGVMNKLSSAFLEGWSQADSWKKLREECSDVIDEEIKKFNN